MPQRPIGFEGAVRTQSDTDSPVCSFPSNRQDCLYHFVSPAIFLSLNLSQSPLHVLYSSPLATLRYDVVA